MCSNRPTLKTTGPLIIFKGSGWVCQENYVWDLYAWLQLSYYIYTISLPSILYFISLSLLRTLIGGPSSLWRLRASLPAALALRLAPPWRRSTSCSFSSSSCSSSSNRHRWPSHRWEADVHHLTGGRLKKADVDVKKNASWAMWGSLNSLSDLQHKLEL